MSTAQLILLLIVVIVVYYYFKKPDPYQDFKKWLDRHPQQKSKLSQKYWDQFFINPETEAILPGLWKMATFEEPTPNDLLSDNKILIPIIREYLREQKGVKVNK